MVNTLVIQPKNQNVGEGVFEKGLPLPFSRYIINALNMDEGRELVAI